MRTCQTCRYWISKGSPFLREECRRDPPIAIEGEIGRWPVAAADDGCGRYKSWPLRRCLRRWLARLIYRPKPAPQTAPER